MDFRDRYGPWAVIAGASEGVGASVARMLGDRGVNVVLVGRRQHTLDEVAGTVATETRSVVLDLDADEAGTALADVTADLEVGLVVYNAGGSGAVPPSSFLDRPVEHWQAIIHRNCAVVVESAYHFGGSMVEREHGGIVLVGSTSCWAGTPGLAIYGATKAFQQILAESLWAELQPHGVDVVAMILGKTDTPAFRRIVKTPQGDDVADCDDVAREMLDSLTAGPTRPPGPSPFGNRTRRQAVERRGEMKAADFG